MNNVTCPKCGGKYVDRSSVTNTVEKTSVRFYCHSCKEYFTIDTETGFHGTLLATFMHGTESYDDDYVEVYRNEQGEFSLVYHQRYLSNKVRKLRPSLYYSYAPGFGRGNTGGGIGGPFLYIQASSSHNDSNGIGMVVNKIVLNDALREKAMKNDAMKASWSDYSKSFFASKNEALLDDMISWLTVNLGINGKTGGGGGCYVATAVYGSYDCPEVWTLRRFRDNTLAGTCFGRVFIRLYYAVSPTLVKWFGKTEWFRKLWKPKLDRLVKHLNQSGVPNTPYADNHITE